MFRVITVDSNWRYLITPDLPMNLQAQFNLCSFFWVIIIITPIIVIIHTIIFHICANYYCWRCITSWSCFILNVFCHVQLESVVDLLFLRAIEYRTQKKHFWKLEFWLHERQRLHTTAYVLHRNHLLRYNVKTVGDAFYDNMIQKVQPLWVLIKSL